MPSSMHRAMRTTARGLIAALFLLAFGRANAQAIVKVNDNVNFKLGILLQPQWDEQQVANAANTDTGGWQQNMLVRRARFVVAGQVAKNVFFYFDTENASLGKSTQVVTAPPQSATGVKAPTTGFNLLDAVGEWRIAKEFNIEMGAILVPTNRWILTSSSATFMLDGSAYNNIPSTALQNNTGRDTGFMARGYFLADHLEYRSGVFAGLRLPGVKNAFRFTEWLQYNVLDTEVYNLPSYAGVNYGNKKILALGGAYDTQSDYQLEEAHMFLDLPAGFGSFESTIVYQHIDGGKFITSLPKQDTFSAEAGVFLKALKIAPVLRYEQKEFSDAVQKPKNEKRYVGGLNFYPFPKAENNFNVKAWFSRVEPKVGFATNEFTLQMQVFYF